MQHDFCSFDDDPLDERCVRCGAGRCEVLDCVVSIECIGPTAAKMQRAWWIEQLERAYPATRGHREPRKSGIAPPDR